MTRRTHHNLRWELADDFAPALESVLQAPFHVIKESPAKLVTRHEVNGRAYYVKRYRHGAFPFRPLKFLFKPSQARQEWRLATACAQRGVPIVRHLALGERWSPRGLIESVLITEAFEGGVPLTQQHTAHFPRVVAFVRQVAAAGVTHHDFHPSNLLLNEGTGELRLVDLHGARVADGTDPERAAEHMLMQLTGILPLPVDRAVAQSAAQWRRAAYAKRARRCLKTNRDFRRQQFGETSWQVRRAALTPDMEAVLQSPDEFFRKAKILKDGRSSTVAAAGGLAMKRYNFKKPLNALKDLFRGSRAMRGFQKSYHLELCGIPTPMVIAAADSRVLGLPLRSYLLMREIPDARDAGQWEGEGAAALGSMIGRLHEEGFTHRDLKETNILFSPEGAPSLIDLDGLAHVGIVPPSEAAANLRRLAEGMESAARLTRKNVIVFLLRYCRIRSVRPRHLFPKPRHRTNHAHRPR